MQKAMVEMIDICGNSMENRIHKVPSFLKKLAKGDHKALQLVK